MEFAESVRLGIDLFSIAMSDAPDSIPFSDFTGDSRSKFDQGCKLSCEIDWARASNALGSSGVVSRLLRDAKTRRCAI